MKAMPKLGRARPDLKLEQNIIVTLSDLNVGRLDELRRLGLWGDTITAVAEQLILDGLKQALRDGFIGRVVLAYEPPK